MGLKKLSDYERRAWDALGTELMARAQDPEKGPLDSVRGTLRAVNRTVAAKTQGALDKLPAEKVEGVFRQTMGGLRSVTLDPAIASVTDSSIRNHYVDLGAPVGSLEEIRDLDLEVIDKGLPPLGARYMLGMGVEGALSAGAVTGAELIASAQTVGTFGAGAAPGAVTVVAAMATDAATLVAGSARLVARTAAFHGFPITDDEAKIEALATLAFGMTGPGPAKVVAFRELSNLTHQLADRTRWDVVGESVLVRVLVRLYADLGLKITQRKLGQAIPVAGIAIGAGLNASFARRVAEDARFAYRVRFLAEKAGVDPVSLIPEGFADVDVDRSDVIDLEEILDEELKADPTPETD